MSAKSFRITLQDRSFEVEVLDDPNRPEVRVRVDGRIWPVTVEDLAPAIVAESVCTLQSAAPTSAPATELESSAEANKTRRTTIVKAPLPGVITAVFVQSEQPAHSGQDLCSIETMKMNNVIQAPVAGVIGRIWVCQGQAVNFEDPLVEIRP